MKNHKPKLEFRPSTLMVALALLFFFGSAISPLSAEKLARSTTAGQQTSEETVERGTPSVCQQDLRLYAYDRLKKYRDDINTHFQNKSSTASLLPDATAIYDEFVQDMNTEFSTYFPDNGISQSSESTEIQDCIAVLNDNLEQARSFLRVKAVATSSVKQTTALLEKYKAINEQLSVLNKSVLQFKSYMETFATKVPCYIEKDCNAG